MKIGDKVKIKEDLPENSVAYCQRGGRGIIKAIDTTKTFPYFVPLDGFSDRFCWFWKDHLTPTQEEASDKEE